MTGPQREKNCLCLTGGLAWGASALQRHDAGIGLPQAPASSPASAAEARSLVDYLNLGIVVPPIPPRLLNVITGQRRGLSPPKKGIRICWGILRVGASGLARKDFPPPTD